MPADSNDKDKATTSNDGTKSPPLDKRWSSYHPGAIPPPDIPPPPSFKNKPPPPPPNSHKSPRQSNESKEPLPLPPPPIPPSEAIPLGLGPDGRSLLPKLSPDGEPLKGPPLGKDGKPLPPPPIIGPDGKELPRPKDANGRPLPIYVSPEGKPVLDKDGNPIPLRFNKEGKPIPLEIEYPAEPPPPESKGQEGQGFGPGPGPPPGPYQGPPPQGPPPQGSTPMEGQKADKIPDCVFYAGIIDIVASIIVTGIVTYFMSDANQKAEDPEWKFLAGSVAVSAVGCCCGVLPMLAAKQNKSSLLWFWFGVGAFLLIVELGVLFSAPKVVEIGNIIAAGFCAIRVIYTLCTNLIFANTEDSVLGKGQRGQEQGQYYYQQRYSAAAEGAYPRANQGYYHYQEQQQQVQSTPSQMVMAQPQTTTTVVVQQPVMSYGYAYPSYGYGYGAGLGMGLGMGMAYGGYGGYGMYGVYGGGYCPFYDWSGGFDGFW